VKLSGYLLILSHAWWNRSTKFKLNPAYKGAVIVYQDKCWNGLHMFVKSDTVSVNVNLKDGRLENKRDKL
jgi:hypothetical protein